MKRGERKKKKNKKKRKEAKKGMECYGFVWMYGY